METSEQLCAADTKFENTLLKLLELQPSLFIYSWQSRRNLNVYQLNKKDVINHTMGYHLPVE